MGKDKKHIKKKPAPFKTHSKKTGIIILVVLGLFLLNASVFFYLAYTEAEKINAVENEFRLLPCEEMKKQGLNESWKNMAYLDKGCDAP